MSLSSAQLNALFGYDSAEVLVEAVCNGAPFAGQARAHETAQRHIAPRLLLHPGLGLTQNMDDAGLAQYGDAHEVLQEVHRTRPDIADEVVGQPLCGMWVLRAIWRQQFGDLRRLGGYAAVAGYRAGLEFDLMVPADEGSVMLPGLGKMCLNTDEPFVPAIHRDGELTIGHGKVAQTVPGDGATTDAWLPLRNIEATVAGQTISVMLDDLDPLCAGSFNFEFAGRLDQASYETWEQTFVDAWRLLVERFPAQATEIAAGFRTLVPLADDPNGSICSATNKYVYGAAAFTIPEDERAMALGLLREFYGQGRLNVLHSIAPLCDNAVELLFAPWYERPRPAPTILRGMVAHHEDVRFWQVMSCEEGAAHQLEALTEYWRAVNELRISMDVMELSETLRPTGRIVLASLKTTLNASAADTDDALTVEAKRLADLDYLDHQVSFRLANLIPNPVAIEQLAVAYSRGLACPVESVIDAAVDDQRRSRITGRFARWRLRREKIRHPDVFQRLCDSESALRAYLPTATVADALWVAGDTQAARLAYVQEIQECPAATKPWSGLAMTFADERNAAPAQALLHFPEVVAAFYEAIGGDDPLAAAAWLVDVPLDCVPSLAAPGFAAPRAVESTQR